MKLTSNFKLIEISSDERVPRVLLSRHNFKFNSLCSELLGFVDYVKVYINDKEKMIAVVPCTKQTEGATRFYRPENKKCKDAKWTNKRFLNLISKIGNFDLDKTSVWLYPQLTDDKVIYFDLSKAKESS